MEFTIQAVFSRSATLELCTDTRYNAPEGVRVLLDGVPVDFGARNVFSLHGLEPGMCYTVAVEQGGVRTERRFVTGTETALLDVRRFGAAGDGMIVHSFSPRMRWLEDFSAFAAALGVGVTGGESAVAVLPGGMPLTLGWAKGEARFLRL